MGRRVLSVCGRSTQPQQSICTTLRRRSPWPRFDGARPNDAHRALAELESRGRVHQLITQNVDDLHQEAGSRAVVQLHGRNRVVVCLDCDGEIPRAEMQERLREKNAQWLEQAPWDRLHADEAEFAPETLAEMTSVAFPGLAGVLPDYGRFDPLDWGLGVQLNTNPRSWMGSRTSDRAFGHFGGSGTFLWVDSETGVACAALSNRDFGDWAKAAWPTLSDDVLRQLGVAA